MSEEEITKITPTIKVDKIIADIKRDDLIRKDLSLKINYMIDAEEEKMVKNKEVQEQLSSLSIPSLHKIDLKGLKDQYDKWRIWASEDDPKLIENYLNNMTAIIKELEPTKASTIYVDEYNKAAKLLEEKNLLYQDAKKKLKKGMCGLKTLTTTRDIDLNISETKGVYKGAEFDYKREKNQLVKECKEYEKKRQLKMTGCTMNFIFNKIEYHGRAVEKLSKIMTGFKDSEKEVQEKVRKGNRFYK